MAEKNSVVNRVIKVVAFQLGINESEIKPESHIVDDLGADSLDTVELVMEIENEFDLKIEDAEAEKLLTVQAIIDKVISEKPELAWKIDPKGKIKSLAQQGFFHFENKNFIYLIFSIYYIWFKI